MMLGRNAMATGAKGGIGHRCVGTPIKLPGQTRTWDMPGAAIRSDRGRAWTKGGIGHKCVSTPIKLTGQTKTWDMPGAAMRSDRGRAWTKGRPAANGVSRLSAPGWTA